MSNEAVFESKSIPKAVFTMAVPTVLSMLVTIFYNMADTFFVGQTGDALQVAAVSLSNPYFMFFMGSANIFGIGGSSCISRALGAKNNNLVKNIAAFCFWGCIVVAAVISGITLLFMDQILPLLGASENTMGYAEEYLTWVAIGGVFIIISNCYGNLVRGEGAAKISMCGMLIGTITNIVLDPIFILVLGMGAKGAAIATVIGNVFATVFYMIYLFTSKSTQLTINPKYIRFDRNCSLDVLAIGVPVFLSNVLMSCSGIIYNNILSSYGDNPIAAMGIANRSNSVVFMVQMGFALATQPLMGYAYGAHDMKRFKKIMHFTMLCTIVFGTVMTIIFVAFTPQIIGLFIQDEEVIYYGVRMLRAFMIAGPFIGIMFTYNYAFQALGRATAALVLSVCRQGLIYLPVLFLMNYFTGMNGVIYAQAIADLASIILSIIMFTHVMRQISRDPAYAQAQDAQ